MWLWLLLCDLRYIHLQILFDFIIPNIRLFSLLNCCLLVFRVFMFSFFLYAILVLLLFGLLMKLLDLFLGFFLRNRY